MQKVCTLIKKTKTTCYNCQFFYVTYDPKFPYGCRAMGFKGRKFPMKAVRETSGMQCLSFVRKEKKKKPRKTGPVKI
jgi:hypothetical protein